MSTTSFNKKSILVQKENNNGEENTTVKPNTDAPVIRKPKIVSTGGTQKRNPGGVVDKMPPMFLYDL